MKGVDVFQNWENTITSVCMKAHNGTADLSFLDIAAEEDASDLIKSA